MLQVNLDITTL